MKDFRNSTGYRIVRLSVQDMLRTSSSFTPFVYSGGPILARPELVSLFWGPFSDFEVPTMRTYLQEFAAFLSGKYVTSEDEEPVLRQYGVIGATFGASYALAEAPSHATDGDILTQIRVLQRQRAPIGYDSLLPGFSFQRLFIVFTKNIQFPNSDLEGGVCAYHSTWGAGKYYVLFAFPSTSGEGTLLSSWQSMTSRAIMEAIIDPAAEGGWTVNVQESAGNVFCERQEVILPFGTVQQFVNNCQQNYSIYSPTKVKGGLPQPIRRHSGFLVQSRFGARGNLELVVPQVGGGLAFYFRDNDVRDLPWYGPFPFGSASDQVEAVALVQSNFSSSGNGPGNLELVARVGDRLDFYFRDDYEATTPHKLITPVMWSERPYEPRGHYWPLEPRGRYFDSSMPQLLGEPVQDDYAATAWHGPITLMTGVSGTPAFIQSRIGARGDFELVVPQVGGGLAFYFRDNDVPGLPWYGPFPFGSASDQVEAVALIQSNFSSSGNGPGNLELVARVGDRLDFYFRDDHAAATWHGPITLMTGVSGTPMRDDSVVGQRSLRETRRHRRLKRANDSRHSKSNSK